MSADNWTQCPNCKAKAQEKMKELELKLDASYGKVSKEEYQAILDEVKNPPAKLDDTLREDYEIGIYNGKFFVEYKGGCSVCGWYYEYSHEDKNLIK